MPEKNERIRSLQSTVLFHELSREDLVDILKKFKEERHPAGTVIFDTNTSGDKVFVIEEGLVRISRVTAFGDETTLDMLGRGEVVGELASIDGQSRSARATCIEDSILLSL
jgi:CRP-like cAMP-binding protein